MTTLQGCRVLVLEDEYFLAEELEDILASEGAKVVGPFSSLAEAEAIPLDQIDAAVLNVRLRGALSYPFAKKLRERGIPFVFASGQERANEPKEWHDAIWLTKPYQATGLTQSLVEAIRKRP